MASLRNFPAAGRTGERPLRRALTRPTLRFVRSPADHLQHVVGAGPEDDSVDQHEAPERGRNAASGPRPDRIRGAQPVVDRPALAAALPPTLPGHHPPANYGDSP